MIKISRVGLLKIVCLLVVSPSLQAQSDARYPVFSSEKLYRPEKAPSCKFLVDSYCQYLHSPESEGNLIVKRAKGPIEILCGNTENEFSQAFYRYSEAKMRNRRRLPADFRRVLERSNYFGKLKSFLGRPSRSKMSLQTRLSSEKSDYELGYLWNAALNETVLLRMGSKYSGFHSLPERLIPIELQLETRRVRRLLIAEISQGLWKDDPNWARVEEGFSRLQESFLRMIPKLDIDPRIQQDWIKRIREVKLVLPGSMPAIADDECSTTRSNAYYYTYLNLITVCAGDFNSEDVLLTLAHEMAHSLGLDRSRYLFEIQSEFGKDLAELRNQVCQPKAFSCESWSQYKQEFSNSLKSLDGYQPELPQFQRCLKQRPTQRILTGPDLIRFAQTLTNDRVAELASSNKFLRITKEQIPMADKSQKNPNFLDPCSYYLWSRGEEPIDDELTTLLYFTAEYRCSQGPEASRIRRAIETSKKMTTQLVEKTLRLEGEFSAKKTLGREGFASPPMERFADVVGSYAMAELLSEIPETWDRQNVFLASSSWQCAPPSLARDFPEEISIESEYFLSNYSFGEDRRKEILSEPLRKTLGCEKDFEFRECRLPFKDDSKSLAFQTSESALSANEKVSQAEPQADPKP